MKGDDRMVMRDDDFEKQIKRDGQERIKRLRMNEKKKRIKRTKRKKNRYGRAGKKRRY